MDPTLYNRIYGKRIDKQVIREYHEPVKPNKFYYLTIDYVWEN